MKILAIDSLVSGVTSEDIQPHLPEETKTAWKLYKSGIFREMYMRGDRPGVVIILECENVEEARKVMSELPLVKENLTDFQYIPLDPFLPFESLFDANKL